MHNIINLLTFQTRENRLRRGPGDEPLGQVSPVVPAGRRQVVGYRRVQGDAAHRKSRRLGQVDQGGLVGRVQFFGCRHVGHFLSDQSVLAAARVARRRGVVFVRGEDNRRHLQVLGVLFGPDGLQTELYRQRVPTVRSHQGGTDL